MAAGVLVGAVNIGLARAVVGRRLRLLADRMRNVATKLLDLATSGDLEKCTPETCRITVDSEDEIGESGLAFNHLVDALALSHQTEAAVHTFSDMLASQLELDVLVSQALQLLLQHTNASAGAILVENDGEMHLSTAYGIRSPDTLVASDHVWHALRNEKRLRVLLPGDLVVEGVLTDFRPREVLVDPIFHKHVPLGAIVLASATGFSERVLERLDLFRQGLALALNNALTHDRLQQLAALDPLTGLYNRRFGMARLHEEFGRAVRASLPLGVMMFDIDHFKSINDTYGHIIGDRVLSHLAKVARPVVREGDVMLRFGGEEFLAILPAASREDVTQAGERLRRMVEDACLREGDQVIRVTISIGATAYPEFDAADDLDLVKHVDTALYVAKEAGRNRVIVN
jgi:diguanylate cyclase (GGDEF)-like protein